MRSWSFFAGRVFGIEIRVHLTFLLLLAYVLMTEAATGHVNAERSVALVAIIFGSVVLHELAHALAALHSERPPRSVILLPIGGISVVDELAPQDVNPAREARIAIFGPLLNLLIAFIAGAILQGVSPELALLNRPWIHSAHLLRSLVWVNLFLGAINLLPAYPLDGGRIVRALLLRSTDEVRATRRAVTVSQGFAMLFILAGMLVNTWLVLVGLFLFVAAQLQERSAVFHAVLQSVRLEEVMLTDFATLSPADTLEEALQKAVHSLQDDFPVVRGGDLVGIISKQKILEALRSSGNGYVQPVMERLYEAAGREESLSTAFRKISRRGLSLVPVVDGGRLVGIVTLQNLIHSMALLAESRKLKRAE